MTVTGRAVWSYAQTTAEPCGVELDLQLALVPDKRVPALLRVRARDVPRACP